MEILFAVLTVIAIALLWTAWELHRIAQLAVNWMRGYEDGLRQRLRDFPPVPPYNG